MGEAKRKRQQAQQINHIISQVDFARVAGAVHRLARAASEQFGQDCVLQALLAQSILDRLGVKSELCVGKAAWRVGDGDGDVISHVWSSDMKITHPKQLPFHAWLRVGSYIFDVTTEQLRDKAQQLDVLDGGKTQVDWAPDHLLLPVDEVATYEAVRSKHAGLSYYKQDAALQALVLAPENFSGLDPHDANFVWIAYQNPSAQVLGPFNT